LPSSIVIESTPNHQIASLFYAQSELDTSPLGHSIANSFLTVTEDNFDSEGRPAWAGLSPVTFHIDLASHQNVVLEL
jgi:phage gpG-like protein